VDQLTISISLLLACASPPRESTLEAARGEAAAICAWWAACGVAVPRTCEDSVEATLCLWYSPCDGEPVADPEAMPRCLAALASMPCGEPLLPDICVLAVQP
jgi:hypothetical protein